jgi:hypothetical protein
LGGETSSFEVGYYNAVAPDVYIHSGGNTWTFDTTGNLTLPSNSFAVNYANGDPVVIGGGGSTGDITFVNTTISAPTNETIFVQALSDNGEVNSSLRLDPDDTLTRLEQWSGQDSQSWTDADWSPGVYTTQGGLGAVVFTGAATIINAIDALGSVGQIFFSVNGGPELVWDGSSAGATNITFLTPTLPDTDPTTVTTFEYFYSYKSGFEIDYDSNLVSIYANNADIELQTNTEGDINISSFGDATMLGNGAVGMTNRSGADAVYITTNADTTPYQWNFDATGNLNTPQGGYIGAAGIKGGGTMLTGGPGNITSVSSYYADTAFYSSCVTANPDGTLNITTYGNGTGELGQWVFNSNNLKLANVDYGSNVGEAAALTGTRTIVNGINLSLPYSAVLTANVASLAYTSTAGSVSTKVTFAVQSNGTGPGSQWEQFDVAATFDTSGGVNFVVSNRVKANNAIPDTVVTASVVTGQMLIYLTLDAGQDFNGTSSFSAVEFGLMVD